MKKRVQPEYEVKKSKWFWAYWVVGVILAVLGTFLLPIWENTNVFWKSWADKGQSLMLFACVAIYIAYLVCGIKKDSPRTKIFICMIEVLVLCVLAILCLLQQFKVLDIIGPCFVVGAILWLRGVVCTLNAYQFNVRKKDRTLGIVLCSLIGVTLGVLLMVRRFTAPIFIWAISIGLILIALMAILFGFLAIPAKEK